MKTITMDYETYLKEQEEIKEKSFEEGFERGADAEREFISTLLESPVHYYGEDWIREMAGNHSPQIEAALIKLHSKKEKTRGKA